MRDMNAVVGSHDIVLLTLDTLRYDVAAALHAAGATPGFGSVVPHWEQRHTPASFTLPAHMAFFAGFLPTPVTGPATRLFACGFEGSETIGASTAVFDAPDIIGGLANEGYRTVCIGGTGFFNQRNPLGRVLPGYFDEAHWSPSVGVADPHSFEAQLDLAEAALEVPGPIVLFVNVSAIHQPNSFYRAGGEVGDRADADTLETHGFALQYVDAHVERLWQALRVRGPAFVMACSDHGTAYGEGGLFGHRVAHEVVWTVPYADFVVGDG